MNETWENEGGRSYDALTEEEPLEWDADSTEGDDVQVQPLPDFEPTLFTVVPGREVIDAQ